MTILKEIHAWSKDLADWQQDVIARLYSRVFKHACRARDRREPILPNAKLEPKAAGIAQAVLGVEVQHMPNWRSQRDELNQAPLGYESWS